EAPPVVGAAQRLHRARLLDDEVAAVRARVRRQVERARLVAREQQRLVEGGRQERRRPRLPASGRGAVDRVPRGGEERVAQRREPRRVVVELARRQPGARDVGVDVEPLLARPTHHFGSWNHFIQSSTSPGVSLRSPFDPGAGAGFSILPNSRVPIVRAPMNWQRSAMPRSSLTTITPSRSFAFVTFAISRSSALRPPVAKAIVTRRGSASPRPWTASRESNAIHASLPSAPTRPISSPRRSSSDFPSPRPRRRITL